MVELDQGSYHEARVAQPFGDLKRLETLESRAVSILGLMQLSGYNSHDFDSLALIHSTSHFSSLPVFASCIFSSGEDGQGAENKKLYGTGAFRNGYNNDFVGTPAFPGSFWVL